MAIDPRDFVMTLIAAVAATKDDGATAASIGIIYEGGPETFREMFVTAGYDAVIAIGRHTEVESGDMRRIQDVPLRYTATIPLSVAAVDKTGVTATLLLNKIRLSLIANVEAGSTGALDTFTLQRDEARNQRMGGYDPLWMDRYIISQRPLEGSG